MMNKGEACVKLNAPDACVRAASVLVLDNVATAHDRSRQHMYALRYVVIKLP